MLRVLKRVLIDLTNCLDALCPFKQENSFWGEDSVTDDGLQRSGCLRRKEYQFYYISSKTKQLLGKRLLQLYTSELIIWSNNFENQLVLAIWRVCFVKRTRKTYYKERLPMIIQNRRSTLLFPKLITRHRRLLREFSHCDAVGGDDNSRTPIAYNNRFKHTFIPQIREADHGAWGWSQKVQEQCITCILQAPQTGYGV